jgi:phage shock protein B
MSDDQLAIFLSLLPGNIPVIMMIGASLVGVVWVTLHYVHKIAAARAANRPDSAAVEAIAAALTKMEERINTLERLVVDVHAPGQRTSELQGGWHGLG